MKLLDRFGLRAPIVERTRAGMPLWGTCMGMIVAAHDVAGLDQPTLDLIDITVRRNAFGRQNDSAEVPLRIPALGAPAFPAIFIRAPWIERSGPGVQTLAERDGMGVMVRQGNVLATSFHPELTGDDARPSVLLGHGGAAREGFDRGVNLKRNGEPVRFFRNAGRVSRSDSPGRAINGRSHRYARLSGARVSYRRRRPAPDHASAEIAIDVASAAFERVKERLRPEERLAITQMLTETRMTFVRKRGT